MSDIKTPVTPIDEERAKTPTTEKDHSSSPHALKGRGLRRQFRSTAPTVPTCNGGKATRGSMKSGTGGYHWLLLRIGCLRRSLENI